jgi:methyltransferase-like protein
VATPSERPCASLLAREQARSTPLVTNRRHQVVALDEVSQNTIAHLDGQHDRASLSQLLREAMSSGRLSIYRNGVPLGRGDIAESILDAALDGALATLAQKALLVS